MSASDALLVPLRRALEDLPELRLPRRFRLAVLGQGTYDRVYGVGAPQPRFVVRVRVHEDPASATALESEHCALRALDGRHAPRSHHLDTSRERLPYAFRVEDFCPGSPPPDFTRPLVQQLARALAVIHSRRYPRSGQFPGTEESYAPGGAMAAALAAHREYSPRGRELAVTLGELVDRARPRYEGFARFSIVHGDIHLANVRLDRGPITLIDWEHTTVADPALDIATLFWFSAAMGTVADPLPEELRALFFDEYERESGDRDIRERVAAHEPVVLLLQLLASDAQLIQRPAHLSASALSGQIARVERYLAGFEVTPRARPTP